MGALLLVEVMVTVPQKAWWQFMERAVQHLGLFWAALLLESLLVIIVVILFH
jgi:hypothetical protein